LESLREWDALRFRENWGEERRDLRCSLTPGKVRSWLGVGI